MAKLRDKVSLEVFVSCVCGAFILQVILIYTIFMLSTVGECDYPLSRAVHALGQRIESGSFGSPSQISPSVAISPMMGMPASAEEEESARKDSARLSNFKPLSLANYPFVLFSVYRHSLKSFFVLGETSVIVRQYENDKPVYRCEWQAHNGSNDDRILVTDAQLLYVRFDENGMSYVPAIVNCTFNETVGDDGQGGILRLHVSKGPDGWGPHYNVEDVLHEKPGDIDRILIEESALPKKYAFCGPPMFGNKLNTDWIQKWLAYHHHLYKGNAHFYFYDVGGIDAEGRQMLEPWIKADLVTIVDALGATSYPAWWQSQVLLINDCIHRTRFTYRWSVFHDLDEFLDVPAPNSLDSLLEQYSDVPWMTFANFPFSTAHCSIQEPESTEKWEIERLLWNAQQPECTHDEEDPWMCIGSTGRRKFVVNPRKAFASGVHSVSVPEMGGINFNGSVARVLHFHGALISSSSFCGSLVNMTAGSEENRPNPEPEKLNYCDSIALNVPEARQFASALLSPSPAKTF